MDRFDRFGDLFFNVLLSNRTIYFPVEAAKGFWFFNTAKESTLYPLRERESYSSILFRKPIASRGGSLQSAGVALAAPRVPAGRDLAFFVLRAACRKGNFTCTGGYMKEIPDSSQHTLCWPYFGRLVRFLQNDLWYSAYNFFSRFSISDARNISFVQIHDYLHLTTRAWSTSAPRTLESTGWLRGQARKTQCPPPSCRRTAPCPPLG